MTLRRCLASIAVLILAAAPAAGDSYMTTMTLASYNLHVGVPMGQEIGQYKVGTSDLDNIAATLAETKPDIAAMQEVDCEYGLTIPARRRSSLLNEARYIAGGLGCNYIFGSAQDDIRYPSDNAGYVEWGSADHWRNNDKPHGEVGNAIVTRLPISGQPENIPLPKDEGQERRACIRAEIDVPAADGSSTRTVVVYATHLQHDKGSTRYKQMQAIVERASREAADAIVFIMGDMNHELDDKPENPIQFAMGHGFHDLTAPVVGRDDDLSGFTYPADKPDSRIDFIFCNRPLKVLEKKIIKSMASDHLPVAVTVELP